MHETENHALCYQLSDKDVSHQLDGRAAILVKIDKLKETFKRIELFFAQDNNKKKLNVERTIMVLFLLIVLSFG